MLENRWEDTRACGDIIRSAEGFGLLKDKCVGTIRQNHLIICRVDVRMKGKFVN
jgi:hypothetical protein